MLLTSSWPCNKNTRQIVASYHHILPDFIFSFHSSRPKEFHVFFVQFNLGVFVVIHILLNVTAGCNFLVRRNLFRIIVCNFGINSVLTLSINGKMFRFFRLPQPLLRFTAVNCISYMSRNTFRMCRLGDRHRGFVWKSIRLNEIVNINQMTVSGWGEQYDEANILAQRGQCNCRLVSQAITWNNTRLVWAQAEKAIFSNYIFSIRQNVLPTVSWLRSLLMVL